MKKLSDFGGNTDIYNFYIRAHKVFSEMEKQRVDMMAEEQIEESTTVNMSPYKESIKNAETPKKKSAKSKVEMLQRK